MVARHRPLRQGGEVRSISVLLDLCLPAAVHSSQNIGNEGCMWHCTDQESTGDESIMVTNVVLTSSQHTTAVFRSCWPKLVSSQHGKGSLDHVVNLIEIRSVKAVLHINVDKFLSGSVSAVRHKRQVEQTNLCMHLRGNLKYSLSSRSELWHERSCDFELSSPTASEILVAAHGACKPSPGLVRNLESRRQNLEAERDFRISPRAGHSAKPLFPCNRRLSFKDQVQKMWCLVSLKLR